MTSRKILALVFAGLLTGSNAFGMKRFKQFVNKKNLKALGLIATGGVGLYGLKKYDEWNSKMATIFGPQPLPVKKEFFTGYLKTDFCQLHNMINSIAYNGTTDCYEYQDIIDMALFHPVYEDMLTEAFFYNIEQYGRTQKKLIDSNLVLMVLDRFELGNALFIAEAIYKNRDNLPEELVNVGRWLDHRKK